MPEPHPRPTRFRRSRAPGVLRTNCGDLFRRTELRERVHRGLDHVETVLGAERLADRVTDAEKQEPAPKAECVTVRNRPTLKTLTTLSTLNELPRKARGNAPSEARETSPKASPKGAKRSREAEAAMKI